MKKTIGLVVAVAFVATIGVAGDAFARGGGSGGGSAAPSAPAPAPAPSGPSPSPSNLTDNLTDTTGVSAFPRFEPLVPVSGCTTTNFGWSGGIVPCPNR
jgi:hypothetical protein